MKFVRQSVVDWHARPLRQRFDHVLSKAAIFNGIIDSTQYAGGIFDTFLFADVTARRTKISDMCTLIMSGHLKPNAGASRVFFEDESYLTPFEGLLFSACVFRSLQISGEL